MGFRASYTSSAYIFFIFSLFSDFPITWLVRGLANRNFRTLGSFLVVCECLYHLYEGFIKVCTIFPYSVMKIDPLSFSAKLDIYNQIVGVGSFAKFSTISVLTKIHTWEFSNCSIWLVGMLKNHPLCDRVNVTNR